MTIINCKNLEEAGRIAAGYVLKTLFNKPNAIYGFPTGNSPLYMYKYLVNETIEKGYNWNNVITFNLDEYYKLEPAFKDESYESYMDKNFFNKININKANVHFPYIFGMNEMEISNYDSLIDSFNGVDLMILGVGENGHIAFNEPPTEIDSLTRIVKLSDNTRKNNSIYFNNDINNVPQYAVTVGLKSILKSKKIILIACGENKRNALQHLKNATDYDPEWPVTSLYNVDNLIVLTDLYYNDNEN